MTDPMHRSRPASRSIRCARPPTRCTRCATAASGRSRSTTARSCPYLVEESAELIDAVEDGHARRAARRARRPALAGAVPRRDRLARPGRSVRHRRRRPGPHREDGAAASARLRRRGREHAREVLVHWNAAKAAEKQRAHERARRRLASGCRRSRSRRSSSARPARSGVERRDARRRAPPRPRPSSATRCSPSSRPPARTAGMPSGRSRERPARHRSRVRDDPRRPRRDA